MDRSAAAGIESGGIALGVGAADPPPNQTALPTMRRVVDPGEDPFAHPAERDLARLFDFYRVRWVYEPTAFAIDHDAHGRPRAFFTPDFYLPDHRCYLELTTMRQELVTRKNRKLRLLREHFPNVSIRLLYRRDCARIAELFPDDDEPARPARLGRVLFPDAEIRARVDEMAGALAASLADRSPDEPTPLLLRLGNASSLLPDLLAAGLRRRGVVTAADRLHLSRYRPHAAGPGVAVRRAPVFPLAGRRVVLVADVVNTGLSFAYLRRWLLLHGAAGVEICALLDRAPARLVDVPIAHAAFAAPDQPLAGWGLHAHGPFRDLPYIATVEPDVPGNGKPS